ncbi:hypothetical protein B0H19DRAFT_1247741 [Mycena capillaripes]|nr:hypothetical protein B0H19DRAFT_1247741 [Mycena capillaripes]
MAGSARLFDGSQAIQIGVSRADGSSAPPVPAWSHVPAAGSPLSLALGFRLALASLRPSTSLFSLLLTFLGGFGLWVLKTTRARIRPDSYTVHTTSRRRRCCRISPGTSPARPHPHPPVAHHPRPSAPSPPRVSNGIPTPSTNATRTQQSAAPLFDPIVTAVPSPSHHGSRRPHAPLHRPHPSALHDPASISTSSPSSFALHSLPPPSTPSIAAHSAAPSTPICVNVA